MTFGMIQWKLSSLRLALGLFAAGMSAFSPVYAQQNVISTGSASGSPLGSLAGAANSDAAARAAAEAERLRAQALASSQASA